MAIYNVDSYQEFNNVQSQKSEYKDQKSLSKRLSQIVIQANLPNDSITKVLSLRKDNRRREM